MPVFGSKKQRPPESSPEAETAPGEPTAPASERYAALVSEHAQINATLEEHREKRTELLREEDQLDLDAIRALASEDEALKLRLEQIALRLPGIEQELAQERREEWEAAWQSHRPVLAVTEAELSEATRAFLAALERSNKVYARAESFGERLREFVRPPPTVVFNEWALRQYLQAIEARRNQPVATPVPMLEMMVEAPLFMPAAERFVPKRVPVAEIEAIGVMAPSRKVRILHGPCRTTNLNVGISRMGVGEEHVLPAKAAFMLTYSGIAAYADVETAEAATAA